MEDIKTYKLGDVVNVLDYKRIPLSSTQRQNKKGIYPYYGAQGIIDYIDDYIFDGEYLLIAEDGENLKSQKQNIAQIAKGKYWVNNHAHIVESNGLCDIRYVCYLLNMMDLSGYITGSAQPKLNQANLLKIELKLPSLKEQYKIAQFLNLFDNKIELNRRINENLEHQAQALFKSWFVDFEPFKDGKFVDSELGMIPEGWRVIPISEIFNFQEGPGIRNWQYVNNNGTKFINIRCINNNIINVSNANMISNEEAQGKYAHFMLNENDIVMSCSGTLGRSAIVLKEYLPLCLNTSVIRFTPKIERQLGLLYGYLGSSLFLNRQMELATGSAQVNFGPTHLKEMSIAVPNDDILNNFSDIVNSMIIKKKAIISEIIRLNNLRDTLLPKLMSGELKLSETETKLDE